MIDKGEIKHSGAEWVRVDLHLHSPGVDTFKLTEGANLNSVHEREDIVKKYVEQLEGRKIKTASITDYNGIREEWFLPIQNLAEANGIIIYPGIELSFIRYWQIWTPLWVR